MKRKTLFLLLLCLALLLAACGGSDPAPLPAQLSAQPADSGPAGLPLDTPITLGDAVELRFLDGFSVDRLTAPIDDGGYYPAEEGLVWIVLYGEIRYSGESECELSELFEAELKPQGSSAVPASLYAIRDNGTDFTRTFTLLPLQTVRAYIAFQVPGACVDGAFDLQLSVPQEEDRSAARGEDFSASFTLAQLEQARPKLSIGDTVSSDTIELTLEGLYFTKSQMPSSSNYRHYYTAPDGNVYYVVKLSVKNCMESRLAYSKIGSGRLVFQEKYQYDGYWVYETNGGKDLEHSGSLAPLESGQCYYLISVPEEVQNGPVALTLFAAGRFYTCVIPESPAPTAAPEKTPDTVHP